MNCRTIRWIALAVVPGCQDAPPARPAGPASGIELVEDLRIDGQREELVPIAVSPGTNSGMALLPNGGVAVAQAQDNQIVFYNQRGRRTGIVGRAGAGPGEFRLIMTIGAVADTVWAFDPRLRRVTLVSPASRFVHTFSLPSPEGLKPLSEVNPGLILLGLQPDRSFVAALLAPELRLVHSNAEGSAMKFLDPPVETAGRFVSEAQGRNANIFDVKAEFAVSPDGKAIGITRPLELSENVSVVSVTMLSATGDTVFSRALTYPPSPIPKTAIDSVLRSRSTGLTRSQAAALERAAYIPVSLPPVKMGLFGRDGTLWLRLDTASDSQLYLLLDGTGEEIGVATFPRGTSVHAADTNAAWTVLTDEFDVPSIVRYRIIRKE